MSRASAISETRSYGRAAGMLSVALGSAGVLAYLYFALASHSLDSDSYGEIVVLWSLVYIAAATLFRPVEQLLARSLAEAIQLGRRSGPVVRSAAAIQGAIGVVAVALLLAAQGPIRDGLLDGEAALYLILLAALLASAATYFARGFLAGRRQFGVYTALLVVEAVGRVTFALVVALGIASGRDVVALGVAAGPLLGLVVLPAALRSLPGARRPALRAGAAPGGPVESGEPGKPEWAPRPSGPELTLARGSGFAGAVLLIMLSEQLIMNLGPLLVRVFDGPAAAGFIFNVLLVARAPLVIFQAVVASLLPHLTRLLSRGDETGEQSFRLAVRSTILVVVAFAGLAAAVLAVAGPQLMQLTFGDSFDYDRAGLLIVAGGMGLYLSASTLSQAALAQGQARRAAACWLLCAAVFAGFNLLPILDQFRRVQIGLVLAAGLLCVLLFALYRRPHPRPEDVPAPHSAAELEARLAAADETG